jgi:ring-1,2-phenylacetyl-CoA epoxidase subunit PaaD
VSELDQIRDVVGRIPDPELPAVTLADLGILRGVEHAADGHVVVTLTPTYSGCPAIDAIRADVARTVSDVGYGGVEVRMTLAPAWTTDWITGEGREKLRAYGIAPPDRSDPACPQCGSSDTREISRFGSTPCQAHHACNRCLEPFDRFKPI